MNGIVLYNGTSRWNQRPIVAIATGIGKGSGNSKTGELVQIWILSAESDKPSDAYFKSGLSVSVCGDCKHDQFDTCYVNKGMAPNNIYKAWKEGKYPTFNHDEHIKYFTDKKVRFGAYGDPAMVPMEVWNPILAVCKKHTAYTHQWDKDWAQDYRSFCMASVDTVTEYNKARDKGWRTFRIRSAGDTSTFAKEMNCPASEEMGKKKTCFECMACHGGDKNFTIAITVHGTGYKEKRWNEIVAEINRAAAYTQLIPLKISARPYGVKTAHVGIK